MKKPKISIITVCYNSEAHIEEALLSVINQSYENKEYLVIDGGSKDGTLNIIEKYKDRIDYFVSEPDKGISDAFNKGIKAATGDIIGILNSDDFMMPNALTKVAEQCTDIKEIETSCRENWHGTSCDRFLENLKKDTEVLKESLNALYVALANEVNATSSAILDFDQNLINER